jgi:predicted alpha-1,2-mannosidase
MKFTAFIVALCWLLSTSCIDSRQPSAQLTDYVNPFVGTAAHGHTFPGATLPFGMVQLSPDTHTEGWDWCSGYHYSDNSIIGFSHTHLSGTGRGELLDVLLMPTIGSVQFNPGTREAPDSGYRSRFSHTKEAARPGFYNVYLEDYGVDAQLTASKRVGFHKYDFQKEGVQNLVIDLAHSLKSDSISEGYIKIIGDSMVVGSRKSRGWGEGDELYWVEHEVFFAARLSRSFKHAVFFNDGNVSKELGEARGGSVKVNLIFDDEEDNQLLVKVGISSVDIDGAINNVDVEIPHWDFDKTRQEANAAWEKVLETFIVEDDDTATKETFYTAVYHACVAPFTASDSDGRYMGFDRKIHQAKGFTMMTGLSLWDTFRAANPLYTLIDTALVTDIIQSMLAQYDQYGLLPVWPLCNSETNCMIGYHAVPVIVDAYLKGIKGFDAEKAYQAMKKSAMQDDFDIQYLKRYNYIPRDLAPTISVARTLEYAFDDYCIALMAEELGKTEDYAYFQKRAESYKNLLDPETGFMRGKDSNGMFRPDFDPWNAVNATSDFIEGNSWQYSWFVPHDIPALIEGMGGHQRFIERLDSLFQVSSELDENTPMDVSGLIGQYAHGNEPSHHVAYLYTLAGEARKTQERVNQICKELYSNRPDGLCGNEDMGQMSAWYVFSAMGFYPVNPAGGEYVIGKPMFEKIEVKFPNGKSLIIRAKGLSEDNRYVHRHSLNGKVLQSGIINHSQLIEGGLLEFEMGE